ncbi:hypothetical protein Hanom_Chr07g00588501 [Helianthus anomalus]
MKFNNLHFHQLVGNGPNFKNSHWRSQLLTFCKKHWTLANTVQGMLVVTANGPMFEVGTTLSYSSSKGPMFYKMSKVGTASGYF